MIHRIALLIGGLAAAGVLIVAVVRGDRPVLGWPGDAAPAPTAAGDRSVTPAPLVVDTVYVTAPDASAASDGTGGTALTRTDDDYDDDDHDDDHDDDGADDWHDDDHDELDDRHDDDDDHEDDDRADH